jgi:hypothetical protein
MSLEKAHIKEGFISFPPPPPVPPPSPLPNPNPLGLSTSEIVAYILVPILILANVILFVMERLTPNFLTIELFILLIIIFISLALSYNSMYTSAPDSISTLLTLRNQTLGKSIDTLTKYPASVCAKLTSKTAPYTHTSITENNITLLNWAPLTVRLAGYLGGETSVRDGVFDMANGIKYALKLGARSFVFDIDFLDLAPCEPVVMHRDTGKNHRALNTGSIRDGMQALSDKAFNDTVGNNYDPVIIILFLHRIPAGITQQASFFNAIAAAMNPISTNHLGLTEDGNFHNCASESNVFTNNITNYQKKFIVLCNYDTTQIPKVPKPKDNLNFWVNARIWKYLPQSSTPESATTSSLVGEVTPNQVTGTPAYAVIGSTNDFITTHAQGASSITNFRRDTTHTKYTIALGPVEEILSMDNLKQLLTVLGIHSIPMDVIRLGENKNHTDALVAASRLDQTNIAIITSAPDLIDQLGYWIWAGYYRFNTA